MGPLTAGAIAAGGMGMLNTGVQGAVNYWLQKDQQIFNAKQADIQRNWSSNENQLGRDWSSSENQMNRDFQERMSSTAMQRQMEDLKAAGLNPALALGGMGASAAGGSPMGNTASSSGYAAQSGVNSVGNSSSLIGQIMSSATKAMMQDHKDELTSQMHQEINSTAKQLHDSIQDQQNDWKNLSDRRLDEKIENFMQENNITDKGQAMEMMLNM